MEQSRQGPIQSLPLPIALLIIGGPKKTTDRLWSWPQTGFHLLLHILLRVQARGEVPIPQVSWVSTGFEGCELLPLQLLGPLGWVETSIGQPPNSTKLAKFSKVVIAHPCEECKLESRVAKNTTRRKTPSNLGETLRFQKDEIERSVPLHDDIAIPACRKMSQVSQSWKKW